MVPVVFGWAGIWCAYVFFVDGFAFQALICARVLWLELPFTQSRAQVIFVFHLYICTVLHCTRVCFFSALFGARMFYLVCVLRYVLLTGLVGLEVMPDVREVCIFLVYGTCILC